MESQELPSFFSKHTLVLLYIHQNPHIPYLKMAKMLGITERHVVRIVRDLEATGAVRRIGRSYHGNKYAIDMKARVPGRNSTGLNVGELVSALSPFLASPEASS